MDPFLFLILIGILGIFLFANKSAEEEGTTVREEAIGICATALDQTVLKNRNKERILALLSDKKELSNQQIRDELNMSRRSAVRYMDQLERQGLVEQVGVTGRDVIYRLK